MQPKIEHAIRPGAVITTLFGHDIDPVLNVYRFHRAVDRAGGDGLVYCPMPALGAEIEAPSSPGYGTLIRLLYEGFEIRLAHCVRFAPEFVALSESGSEIPAGMLLAAEGSLGKSTGPHTHIELIAVGGRHRGLDAALAARGGTICEVWPEAELAKDSVGRHRSWMKEYGVTRMGPYECAGWDRRNGRMSIWMDPFVVLGL